MEIEQAVRTMLAGRNILACDRHGAGWHLTLSDGDYKSIAYTDHIGIPAGGLYYRFDRNPLNYAEVCQAILDYTL